MAKLTYMPKAILLLASSRGFAPWSHGLPAGVVGCVPSDAPADMLQASIRLVLAGGLFFPAQGIEQGPPEDQGAHGRPMADTDGACAEEHELHIRSHGGWVGED